MKWLALLVLVGCSHKQTIVLRPLATGAWGKYKIEPCGAGHVVKLTYVVDERGEAANHRLVESYRDRYLIPRIKPATEILGWTFDSKCGASGLTMRVPAKAAGEVLHRTGETLAKHPTDIEVTVVSP